MPKQPSRKTLVNKADKVFSEYIRRRYADANGYVQCFTCGKKDFWKSMDAGHFQSRKHFSTRWNETNVQVQCKGCNIFRYGEQYKFGKNLDAIFGEGCAEDLHNKSRQVARFSNQEIVELVNFFQKKLAEL